MTTVNMSSKPRSEKQINKTSRHGKVLPRNPNKRPTTINMERSIGHMKANDMAAIRRAR